MLYNWYISKHESYKAIMFEFRRKLVNFDLSHLISRTVYKHTRGLYIFIISYSCKRNTQQNLSIGSVSMSVNYYRWDIFVKVDVLRRKKKHQGSFKLHACCIIVRWYTVHHSVELVTWYTLQSYSDVYKWVLQPFGHPALVNYKPLNPVYKRRIVSHKS